MGLLERNAADKPSQVVASVIGDTSQTTLQGKVRQHVKPGTQLFTDEHSGYQGLDPEYNRCGTDAERFNEVLDMIDGHRGEGDFPPLGSISAIV